MRKDQVICCFFWGHGQLLGHVALHVVAHGNPSPMTPVGSIFQTFLFTYQTENHFFLFFSDCLNSTPGPVVFSKLSTACHFLPLLNLQHVRVSPSTRPTCFSFCLTLKKNMFYYRTPKLYYISLQIIAYPKWMTSIESIHCKWMKSLALSLRLQASLSCAALFRLCQRCTEGRFAEVPTKNQGAWDPSCDVFVCFCWEKMFVDFKLK